MSKACHTSDNITAYQTLYRYVPHNDVSVNDGPHIRRWSHNIIILTIVLQLPAIFSTVTCCTKVKDQDIYRTIILPVVLYGCETWSLTLREERRLRVFENMVLRRVLGLRETR